MAIRVLAIGDIVGRPGRTVVGEKLPALVRQHRVDLVIANGENIAGGSGITTNLFNKLRAYGVDVVTLGDHAFKKGDIIETLGRSERIVRPANLSRHAAGRGSTVVETAHGLRVGIVCVLGRVLVPTMQASDPFEAIERALSEMPRAHVVIVEVHAEVTGEKAAIAHWLDGRPETKCALVYGTHTHVATADARVLPGGVAFISDLGMTGPHDSILGRRKDMVVRAMSTNMPHPYDVATGESRLCGIVAELDEKTGRAVSIERIEVAGSSVHPAYDADDHAKARD